jgi:hypothetical protein
VTSPTGGALSFAGSDAAAPAGYDTLGTAIDITAPSASAARPLRLVFRVDATAVRSGIPLGVLRDGQLVASCASPTTAQPDPCLLSRRVLPDGDRELVVLSSHASVWHVVQPSVGSTTAACAGTVAPRFTDVGANAHRVAVECMAAAGIASGTSPTTYGPSRPVTRAQMASFVARVLVRAGVELPAQPAVTFTDVPRDAAHATAIAQLAALGVVRGTSPTTYRPDDTVSRAQMATFLVRAFDLASDGALPQAGAPFEDVAGSPHAASIGTVAALGITAGVSATRYVPGAPVARDQMASFLARTLNLLVVEGKAPVGAG